MSALFQDEKKASQAMHRLESITKDDMQEVLEFAKKEIDITVEKDGKQQKAYPVFDLLALHTVKYQKTKGDN